MTVSLVPFAGHQAHSHRGEVPRPARVGGVHPASDIHSSQVSTATNRINPLLAEPVTLRTHDQAGRKP